MEKSFECDDAISREMALKECHDIVVDGERYRVIQEETLLGLPPVTQNSGKWDRSCTCSVCGQWRILESEKNSGKYKFCPSCGAKMESEEISEHNMKMWEGIFKAERGDKE